MAFGGILTLLVLALVFGLLAFTRRSPDVILMSGLSILVIAGVVSPRDAFSGFSNEGILTVGILYIIAAGLQESGGIWALVGWLFRRPGSLRSAQARVMFPVAGMSGFLNNTPLVLMLMPVINDWAKKFDIPASKLLIPLSYASVLGGMCTLIGTSTNLVVNGLLIDSGFERLNMFDLAWVGVPVALAGLGFLLLFGSYLLPDRKPAMATFENPREYAVEMIVDPQSPLVGETIEEAGLRHLPGLYLMEIDRDGEIIAAVGPDTVLRGDDRLVFVGVVDSVVDLQRIRGLKPATEQVFKLNRPRNERVLIEAVVSNSAPFIGKTIRESRFRTNYDAVVIAVARNGERIRKKVGDIVLRPGDTLLVEALPSFIDRRKNSRDFYLVSRIEDFRPPDYSKSWIALSILGLLVALVTTNVLSMLQAAILAAGLLMATGVLTAEQARRSIDWRILISIAAAFGIGQALKTTGAAAVIAQSLVEVSPGGVFAAFVVIYATTMVFTELITNNAAAVLMYPIAVAVAESFGANPLPFAIGIMIAASGGFATPIGYQTHLMVYGPGGYRFTDFLKIGIIMDLIVLAVAIQVIPRVWGF